MKTVLLLNWRDKKNGFAGGAEIFAYEIATRLTQDGFRVIWFASKENNLLSEDSYDQITIIRRGSWKTVYVWAFFYYIFKLRRKIDVIVDCQNGIPFFTPLYTKKKIICVVHHVHKEVFRHFAPSLFIKHVGILLESLMPFVYKNATLVTVSPSTKQAMQSIGFRQNISIIYNGIDHQMFSPCPKTTTPSFLYIGRLKKYKKVDDLLHAFAHILKQHPTSILTIAGTGEESDTLKILAQTLGIQDKVMFTGFVTEEMKRTLLGQSWALIYPSAHEGWGISVIEANASGTISIASRVAGLRDAVQNEVTGLLYTVGDIADLSQKMFSIIMNTAKRLQMEKEALAWSRKFSWDKSYKIFKKSIES